MKIFQIICLLLIAGIVTAQEIPKSDDSGKAEYKNGSDVAGLTKQQLYDRGIAWVNKYYVNPNGVMKT